MKSFVNTYSRFVCLVALSAALAGCGSDGGVVQQVGTFIDDPVGGLTYSCVSGAQTITGTTDSAGHFNYLPGQTCTFSVGKVTLGTLTGIPSDGKVTPQDVAGVARGATTAPSALVIAQFLQSMNDGTTPGKIVIPASVTTALNSATAVTLASSSATISQADLQTLVATVPGKVLVSAATAQAALDTQISSGVVDKTAGAVSTSAPKVLNSIAITNSANPPAGLTDQLTATGYYSDGSTKDLTALASWTSSDTKTLTVDASTGVVTGVAKGSATVTASYTPSGSTTAVTAKYGETVVDPTVTNLVISWVKGAISSLQTTLTASLQAVATFTDQSVQTVTNLVTWIASGGSISSDGLFTAGSVGSASISATYQNTPSNSLSLTITPLTISGSAATGTALQNKSITVDCNGASPVTATTAADGTYSAQVSGSNGPCLLSTSITELDGSTSTIYSAIPSGSSGAVTANVTPITNLVVTNALGTVPTSATSAASLSSTLSSSALSSASTNIASALSTAFGIDSSGLANPIGGNLVATPPDSGVSTNALDKANDQLMAALNMSSVPTTNLASTLATVTSSTAGTTASSFVSTNKLPSSASSGCPYAVSGPYATVNVGYSNLKPDSTNTKLLPTIGVVTLDFSLMKAYQGTNSLDITADTNNPCQFTISDTSSSTGKNLVFTVSPAGFLIATSSAPPGVSASTNTINAATVGVGPGNVCFQKGSGCSGYQLGFPIQSGINLNNAAGTWQSVEWNLLQYVKGAVGTWTSNSGCPGNLQTTTVTDATTGTSSSQPVCSLYVSTFRQMTISTPSNGASTGSSTVSGAWCDGLSQGQNSSSTVANSCENSSYKWANTDGVTLVMCSVNSDCPSYTDPKTSQTAYATSVFDVMQGTQVIGHAVGFKTPGNALVTFFVGGQGGPAGDGKGVVRYNMLNNSYSLMPTGQGIFSEQFAIMIRPPAEAATLPSVNKVVTQPQMKVVDSTYGCFGGTFAAGTTKGTGTFTPTYATTNCTSAPTKLTSSTALNVGMVLSGDSLLKGHGTVTVTAVTNNNGSYTYTISCAYGANTPEVCPSGQAADTSNSNYPNNFRAFGELVSLNTQHFTVTSVTGKAVTRSFDDTATANGVDTVYLDTPYAGMSYRPYVAATTTPSASKFNESVSIRGDGWAIASGTATIRQQMGAACFPGTSGTGCATGTATTGRFFTVNTKY